MPKAAATTLIDEVLETVENGQPGPQSWFDRLPQEAREELESLRQQFDAQRHQKRAFYRALRAAAERRGWQIAGEKQVTLWLIGER
jgi:hypothetical protein